MRQDGTVIFVHIPKAAGTTLRKVILREYKPDTVFVVQMSNEELKEVSEEQRERIRLLMGHMRFGIHALLPQPSTYFSVLREPVDRVISYYYYVLQSPENVLHSAVSSQRIGLGDFVRSGMTPELNNGQTRRLASVGHSIEFGKCPEEILECAKRSTIV
jgi:hypothetical protein